MSRFKTLVMNQLIRRLFYKLGVDRPVFYSSIGQIWSLFSGPVTILLITSQLSESVQGYFYAFGSVAAFSALLELGFAQCITQFASHESAKVRFGPKGQISGDPVARSRLISLGRLSIRWYSVVALLAFLLIGSGGHLFFWLSGNSDVAWEIPWWVFCLVSAMALLYLPVLSYFEGCNQVGFVYGLRTATRVIVSISLWICLLSGFGLFTVPVSTGLSVFVIWVGIFRKWPEIFRQWREPPQSGEISWMEELLPFQWRLAVSWIGSYFAFNFLVPVLFYFHGEIAAGKLGATMQLILSLQALSAAWTISKAPKYGMLVSERRFAEMDALFFKSTFHAILIFAGGSLAMLLALAVIKSRFVFGSRFLDLAPTCFLLFATLLNQVFFSQAIYLQAHKKVPFMWLLVANGLFGAALITASGWKFGAIGIAICYALIQATILIFGTVIWIRCRSEWHQPDGSATLPTKLKEQ